MSQQLSTFPGQVHNLVATLLSSVKAAENAATREFKDWCYAERKSQATKLKARIQAFEVHFQSAMATLRGVFEADDLSDAHKLASLKLLLFPADGEPVLSDAILRDMKDAVVVSDTDDAPYYHILEAKSRRLQNQASGVLKSLSFQAEPHIKPLLAALAHFRKVDGQVTRSAPVAFLDPAERDAVGSGADEWRRDRDQLLAQASMRSICGWPSNPSSTRSSWPIGSRAPWPSAAREISYSRCKRISRWPNLATG